MLNQVRCKKNDQVHQWYVIIRRFMISACLSDVFWVFDSIPTALVWQPDTLRSDLSTWDSLFFPLALWCYLCSGIFRGVPCKLPGWFSYDIRLKTNTDLRHNRYVPPGPLAVVSLLTPLIPTKKWQIADIICTEKWERREIKTTLGLFGMWFDPKRRERH